MFNSFRNAKKIVAPLLCGLALGGCVQTAKVASDKIILKDGKAFNTTITAAPNDNCIARGTLVTVDPATGKEKPVQTVIHDLAGGTFRRIANGTTERLRGDGQAVVTDATGAQVWHGKESLVAQNLQAEKEQFEQSCRDLIRGKEVALTISSQLLEALKM